MAITIKDVAKAANVSIATVSLVMHNHRRISKETKVKVLEIIEQMNYRPSRSARGLVSRRTGNIGFILTNDHFLRTEPFYTHIFIGTEIEARENDFYVLLNTINSDFNERDQLPRFILDRNIDGVIIAGKVPQLLMEKLSHYNFPVVYIDFIPANKNYSTVLVDNVMGGRLATNHLIDLGHKNIAFIGGDIGHPSISDRLTGYMKAIESANLPISPDLIETSENYPARTNGYNAARKLLSVNKNITAIFACNDAMALGVIQYLKDQGKRVPQDVSVMGFDDVVSESSVDPPLCTVRVPTMEMGMEAMKLISTLLKEYEFYPKKIMMPVELVVRQSTQKI